MWSMEQGTPNEAQTIVPGTSIWEVILIGACVAGALAYVFTKIAITLRAADKRGLDADVRRK